MSNLSRPGKKLSPLGKKLSPLGKTARSPSGRIIRPDSGSPFRPMTPRVRRFPPSLRRFPPRRDGGKRHIRFPKKYLKLKSPTISPNHGFKKSKSKSQSRRR